MQERPSLKKIFPAKEAEADKYIHMFLFEEVQRSVQQRPAKDTELRLMELFQAGGIEQEVDLRELIMRLIDQGDAAVNLDVLMRDIESLFQKNLVNIRIKLSRTT